MNKIPNINIIVSSILIFPSRAKHEWIEAYRIQKGSDLAEAWT